MRPNDGQVAFVALVGLVIAKELEGRGANGLCAVRLRLGRAKTPAYCEIVARNENAKALDLCAEVGNVIYAEGHIANRFHNLPNGRQWAELLIVADEFRVVLKGKRKFAKPDAERITQILTRYDPATYLTEEDEPDGR